MRIIRMQDQPIAIVAVDEKSVRIGGRLTGSCPATEDHPSLPEQPGDRIEALGLAVWRRPRPKPCSRRPAPTG